MAQQAQALVGPSIATSLPQSVIRQAVPSAAIPSGADVYRTILPAAIGGAIALVPTMTLFPHRGTIFAGLAFITGSLMAAASPPLTLPQEIGLGAAIASGTWLVTRAVGEIKAPAATAGAVGIPPVNLPDGSQIAFQRRSAA